MVLESATYNWPWDNMGVQISKLTYFMKCACDLLIIIVKTTFTRNCLWENLKNIFNVVGCNLILRSKVVSLACAPVKMCASMTWPFSHVTMNCEPLQSPQFGAILQSNMMGHPTLKCNFNGGTHCKLKEYSIGYKLWLFTPTSRRATSTFNNVWRTLGKMSMMPLLILSIVSFQVHKMIWSLKYSLVCEFTFWLSIYIICMNDNKFELCTIGQGRGMFALSKQSM